MIKAEGCTPVAKFLGERHDLFGIQFVMLQILYVRPLWEIQVIQPCLIKKRKAD